jgi:putative transcriptional regulator
MSKKQVKDLRDSLELTQEEFATAIGVSRSLVNHWETGRRKPTGPAAILLQKLRENPSEFIVSENLKNLV